MRSKQFPGIGFPGTVCIDLETAIQITFKLPPYVTAMPNAAENPGSILVATGLKYWFCHAETATCLRRNLGGLLAC